MTPTIAVSESSETREATGVPEAGERESAAAPYLADFERFARDRTGEPAAIERLRRHAIERFAEIGFPTLRQEEWRSTNVAPIARSAFHRAEGEPDLGMPEIAPWIFDGAAARLTFVDGRFAPALSFAGDLPEGAFAGRLADALAARPDEVLAQLGRHHRADAHAFSALNAAFFTDGACILLPRGAIVERPIHLLFVATGESKSSFPRNLVVLGESAQATVVETYAGSPGVAFTCPVTEIVAGANAALHHVKVQKEDLSAFHVAAFELKQERSSQVDSCSISLGGAIVRNDLHAVLAGEGGDCTLNGLYLAEGRQVVDHHMRVEHRAAHCGSHELYKGILDGKARAVFNGLIHVHKGAQKTDAKQSNRNLLLSAEAIANSNPQLEIYADDVRCTHGSTVGQLDEDAVFYLRSRGIGEEAAKSLLTYAFASELVERIGVEPVRRDLEEFLFARLPGGEIVRQAV